MLRQPGLSTITSGAGIGARLLLAALLTTAPGFCGQAQASKGGSKAAIWADLKNVQPTVKGSLRMADCSEYPAKPCTEYLIQALEYRWKGLRPNELKITDLDQHRAILADHDVDSFLYMFPLNPDWGTLLATVWGTGTTIGVVRVYLLHGNSAKLVFYNGSRFSPQFIQETASAPDPFILLDQGYVMRGNAILPTDTQIWQWKPAAEKFILRATVPVAQKFAAVAKLESDSKRR